MRKLSRQLALIVLSALLTEHAMGLAVDEKLPLRILKVSDSKKTMLINRGVEDGLIVGDHARFFLTTGVVARGILIKLSPTRSVWSLYRLSVPEEVAVEKVMNLKITPPVKLTNDPTKMLAEEDVNTQAPEGVVIAKGANEGSSDSGLSGEESKDLSHLKKMTPAAEITFMSNRSLELWGMFQLDLSTSTNSQGSKGQETKGSSKQIEILVGGEKYFTSQNRWYSALSFYPFIQYMKRESSNVDGSTISTGLTGYGAGVSWHFFHPPMMFGVPIVFVTASFSLGTVDDVEDLTPTVNSTVIESSSALKGKYTAFSGGLGLKYYFAKGIGLRGVLDYYRRGESYTVADSADPFTKIVSGPRILLGLSYRF
jgi:hypothetical protein